MMTPERLKLLWELLDEFHDMSQKAMRGGALMSGDCWMYDNATGRFVIYARYGTGAAKLADKLGLKLPTHKVKI